MLVLRPTTKLATRMNITLSSNDRTSTTRLGDWYANCFSNGRQQLILCVSEKTRISVVMNAAPYSSFPSRFPMALQEVLKALGISDDLIQSEMNEMKTISFGKACNRSITGSLKEFAFQLEHKLAYQYGRPLNFLLECSLYLCEVPCLKMSPSWPKDAAKNAFIKSSSPN